MEPTYVSNSHLRSHRQKTINDTVGKYELRHHSVEMQNALRELMFKTIETYNNDEAYVGTDVVDPIPQVVMDRIKHWDIPTYWNNPLKLCVPKLVMSLSAWIVTFDASELQLMVEKFHSSGSNDDVWRISGDDWSVAFLTTRNTHHLDDHQVMSITWQDLQVDDGTHYGRMPSRYFLNATMFSVSGSHDAFFRDVMFWKLSSF